MTVTQKYDRVTKFEIQTYRAYLAESDNPYHRPLAECSDSQLKIMLSLKINRPNPYRLKKRLQEGAKF